MSNYKYFRKHHLRLGAKGEKAARRFLKTKLYDILMTNYKTKNGEIDIIARDGEVICFIEVKTRRKQPGDIYSLTTFLGDRQEKRIKRASSDYLYEVNAFKVKVRYELIEIILPGFRIKELYHWQSNFGR